MKNKRTGNTISNTVLTAKGVAKAPWLQGVVDGEDCFQVDIKEVNGKEVFIPKFIFPLLKLQTDVLQGIKKRLKCGDISEKHGTLAYFKVERIEELSNNVIPFFQLNPIVIEKEEFKTFSQIVGLMEKNIHLTPDGHSTIKKLCDGLKALKHEKYVRLGKFPSDEAA